MEKNINVNQFNNALTANTFVDIVTEVVSFLQIQNYMYSCIVILYREFKVDILCEEMTSVISNRNKEGVLC